MSENSVPRRQVLVHFAVDLQGPLHIGSGLRANGYADRLVLRDARGLPYLPGSSLKGALRDSAARIAAIFALPACDSPCRQTPCLLCRLFGSVLIPGSLRFGDAVYLDTNAASAGAGQEPRIHRFDRNWFEPRHGVQICRRRRVAQERHKYIVEYTRPTSDAPLVGRIAGMVGDADRDLPLPPTLWALLCALTLTDRFGGLRSRGAGEAMVRLTEILVDGNDVRDDWQSSLSEDWAEYYRDGLETELRR